MKTFKIWLEEKLDREKVGKSLLKALGYTADALHHQNINLDIIPKGNLKRAIQSLPIEDSVKDTLFNFARNNPHDSISNLINQIQNDEIEQQDTDTSAPAVLPQGNQPAPKPGANQQQQQPLG
jgi:hypothetical protein